MLGPLAIERNGSPLELPTSRKACALLAYLALTRRPATRSRLCELLWDGAANDPRGELRWCLSKLRGVLDDSVRRVVVARDDTVALLPDGWFVDALEIAAAMHDRIESLDAERLLVLCNLYGGELLEGLAIERCPEFNLWLTSQRSRYAAFRTELLGRLVERLPAESNEGLAALETWVEIDPFDVKAQMQFLSRLAARGRFDACRKRMAAAERLYKSESLDFAPVREAWRALCDARAAPEPLIVAAADIRTPSAGGATEETAVARRPSLAVMPFRAQPERDGAGDTADGLTHDVITRLAKLRNFFVIAEGSVFALRAQNVEPREAGRRLKVEYVASGLVRRRSGWLSITVELIDVATARILWVEDFDRRELDVFSIIDRVGDQIVASIASEIETQERNRAILRPPDSLDAWQAYHRGLWHMYRFTRTENDSARRFFEVAVQLDPTFARAYAGLSFTHWQSAFQNWGDRQEETARALGSASRAMLTDEHDPAAHWAMGRAQWLSGRHDEAVDELKQCVDLSPNFALGHYTLAFVQSQSGDPHAAIEAADHSRLLSPFDPLLFGMLGSRAMALVRLGRFDEAAAWSVKAAAQPNAHALILAIAALSHALAGKVGDAQGYVTAIRRIQPRFTLDDYLSAFQFSDDAAALFRQAAGRISLA